MLTASNIPIKQMSKAAFLPMGRSGKPATKTFLQPVEKESAVKAWVMHQIRTSTWEFIEQLHNKSHNRYKRIFAGNAERLSCELGWLR